MRRILCMRFSHSHLSKYSLLVSNQVLFEAQTNTLTHTQMRMHTHTRRHTHARTHLHPHAQIPTFFAKWWSHAHCIWSEVIIMEQAEVSKQTVFSTLSLFLRLWRSLMCIWLIHIGVKTAETSVCVWVGGWNCGLHHVISTHIYPSFQSGIHIINQISPVFLLHYS